MVTVRVVWAIAITVLVAASLMGSTTDVPRAVGEFQGWSVPYIPRYTPYDIGEGCWTDPTRGERWCGDWSQQPVTA